MRRLLLLLFVAVPARADDKPVSFERDVRPILARNCFGCHGPDEKARKAKLRLDVEESAKGVIVAGDPDASDLVKRISVTRSAAGEGRTRRLSSSASTNASIGFRTQAEFFTAGEAGRTGFR